VIFEGAQGVLLDEAHGFHPHTTWSTCTFDNALALLDAHGYARPVERIGLLRSYLVRHGPGPFPTEDAAAAGARREPHNASGPWQGPVRSGWPDWVLLRYALAACKGADALALTHLDALDGRSSWRAAVAYEAPGPGSTNVEELAPSFGLDLHRREALTASLFAARPVYREWERGPRTTAAERYVRELEENFSIPVSLSSTGPSASAVRFRK
jgi:adenylosuccinate synthase